MHIPGLPEHYTFNLQNIKIRGGNYSASSNCKDPGSSDLRNNQPWTKFQSDAIMPQPIENAGGTCL